MSIPDAPNLSNIIVESTRQRLANRSNDPYAQILPQLGQNLSQGLSSAASSIGQGYRIKSGREQLAKYMALPPEERSKPENQFMLADAAQKMGLPEAYTASMFAGTTEYNRESAKNRADADSHKGKVQITSDDISRHPEFQAAGYKPDTWITKEEFVQKLKGESPNSSEAKARTMAENRKIVSDYAARNNVSLDALRPGGMGGWNEPNLAMAADTIRNHPDYDIAKLKTEFASQMSGAKTTATTSASMLVPLTSAHDALNATAAKAQAIADRMGQTKFAAFNQAYQAGKRQFNDPDSLALLAHLKSMSANWGRINKGGSASLSDEDRKDADAFISTRLNSGGIGAIKEAADTEYMGRVQSLGHSGGKGGDSKKKNYTAYQTSDGGTKKWGLANGKWEEIK